MSGVRGGKMEVRGGGVVDATRDHYCCLLTPPHPPYPPTWAISSVWRCGTTNWNLPLGHQKNRPILIQRPSADHRSTAPAFCVFLTVAARPAARCLVVPRVGTHPPFLRDAVRSARKQSQQHVCVGGRILDVVLGPGRHSRHWRPRG